MFLTRKPDFILGDPKTDASISMYRTDFWHRVFFRHPDSSAWAHVWRRAVVTIPIAALTSLLAGGAVWGAVIVPHHDREAVATVEHACHVDSTDLADRVFAGPGRTINVNGFADYADSRTGAGLSGIVAAGTVSFYSVKTGRRVCDIPDRF